MTLALSPNDRVNLAAIEPVFYPHKHVSNEPMRLMLHPTPTVIWALSYQANDSNFLSPNDHVNRDIEPVFHPHHTYVSNKYKRHHNLNLLICHWQHTAGQPVGRPYCQLNLIQWRSSKMAMPRSYPRLNLYLNAYVPLNHPLASEPLSFYPIL